MRRQRTKKPRRARGNEQPKRRKDTGGTKKRSAGEDADKDQRKIKEKVWRKEGSGGRKKRKEPQEQWLRPKVRRRNDGDAAWDLKKSQDALALRRQSFFKGPPILEK